MVDFFNRIGRALHSGGRWCAQRVLGAIAGQQQPVLQERYRKFQGLLSAVKALHG
jgi:hypothetical protein